MYILYVSNVRKSLKELSEKDYNDAISAHNAISLGEAYAPFIVC